MTPDNQDYQDDGQELAAQHVFGPQAAVCATGAGFTAFAVAGVSDRVVASDVTDPCFARLNA